MVVVIMVVEEHTYPYLATLRTCDVSNEAPRVSEAAVRVPVDVAVDEQDLHLVALRSEAEGYVVDGLTSTQATEHLLKQLRLIGTELTDVVSDILISCIAKTLQLGFIRPNDVSGA